MGSVGGGVWKTENSGRTWYPISDQGIPIGSIGAIAVAVWPKNSSNVVTLVNGDGVPGGLYFRWVRRSPRSTVLEQNRSCRTTLSTPNTKITSHPPDLTHKKIVSSCPSIRLSTPSVKTAKQASAEFDIQVRPTFDTLIWPTWILIFCLI